MAMVFHQGLNSPASPRVSVCVANFNGEALLPACLDSVLSQDTSEPVEILVHDDASADGSLALLRERYPQVHVLASDENVGFSVSNNRMVALARGEFVLLLNNDAALFPDAVSNFLSAAASTHDPSILTLPQYDWNSGELVDLGSMVDLFCNPVPNFAVTRRDVAYVIGACLWIPRDAWRQLGGFPEWMESIAEDMYLCFLARLRGWPVRVVHASGYRHRQGRSFGGNRIDAGRMRTTYRRRRLSERNKTFVLYVMTPRLMWALLALHLSLLTIEGLVMACVSRSLERWTGIYWPAIHSVWSEHATLRVQRARAQAERKIGMYEYLSRCVLIPRKVQLLVRHGLPVIE